MGAHIDDDEGGGHRGGHIMGHRLRHVRDDDFFSLADDGLGRSNIDGLREAVRDLLATMGPLEAHDLVIDLRHATEPPLAELLLIEGVSAVREGRARPGEQGGGGALPGGRCPSPITAAGRGRRGPNGPLRAGLRRHWRGARLARIVSRSTGRPARGPESGHPPRAGRRSDAVATGQSTRSSVSRTRPAPRAMWITSWPKPNIRVTNRKVVALQSSRRLRRRTARRGSPGAAAVLNWRGSPEAVGGDEGVVMASKDNLHRETLRAALRIIQTAETLEQARIQVARMLNVFDKLEAKGIKGDAAVRPRSG